MIFGYILRTSCIVANVCKLLDRCVSNTLGLLKIFHVHSPRFDEKLQGGPKNKLEMEF